MAFSLSSKNVFDYLIERGLCTETDKSSAQIEPKPAKNFNLLIRFPERRSLLVKQEPYHREGKTAGEFLREGRAHQFFHQFPVLAPLQPWLPEVLDFDRENSIMVIHYLDDHRDLIDFYAKENVFPTSIAASIGHILATIHRLTWNQTDFQAYFSQKLEQTLNDQSEDQEDNQAVNISAALTKGLGRISPEVFGQVPADGLKFFALYQRYDSLGQAIEELSQSVQLSCLAHNDLKLNNILLPNHWEQSIASHPDNAASIQLRLIDWERSAWGDPAFDLGSIITSYLTLWLGSLAVSKSIGIEEALRLAMTPLDVLQPSLAALVSAYFAMFPEILERRPDFFHRVMQFAGLGLVQSIQSILQHQKTFGNSGICMLQVAKTLLCRPEASIPTVFGVDTSKLIRSEYAAV